MLFMGNIYSVRMVLFSSPKPIRDSRSLRRVQGLGVKGLGLGCLGIMV